MRAAVVLSLPLLAAATGSCADQKTCDACVASEYCGWCQPGPIIYTNHVKKLRLSPSRRHLPLCLTCATFPRAVLPFCHGPCSL